MNTETTSKRIAFSSLWGFYPSRDPCVNSRTGKKAYDDQCAIRVGMALERAGVSFKTFAGPRCEFGATGNGMVLRAAELADWLMRRPFPDCPGVEAHRGKGFDKNLAGRTGIVYFQDYWFRNDTTRHRTGDHIDLWNRDRLTPSWQTFLRFSMGINAIPMPGRGNSYLYSDLHEAKRVLFWPFNG